MNQRILEFAKELEKKDGASQSALSQLECEVGIPLPADYKEFLLFTNGAEGKMGQSYLMIWPAEEVMRNNKGYAVEEFAPGLLLFGSSGGGMAYAFDTRAPELLVVEVPFIGMNLESIKRCGSNFTEFLEHLATRH